MFLRHFCYLMCWVVFPPVFSARGAVDQQKPRIRLIWSGPDVNTLGAPSRDGKWISFVETPSGNLAVRNIASGETRRVTRKDPKQQAGEFAYFSVISPDGQQIAYAWFNEKGFYDLRVAEIPESQEALSEPVVLYRNPAAGFVQPCAWSPDGKEILTLLFRRDNISQIALVSAEDGSVRTLKSLNWVYPKRMDFSPDGQFIVYDNQSDDEADERDVFLLAADGTIETRLVAGHANELFPLWAPAGDSVVFASNRSGSMGVWSVPVADGKAAGKSQLLYDDMGRFLPLGMTAAGDLVYGLRTGNSEIYVKRLDSPRDGAEPILQGEGTDRFAPAFSPQGGRLAYLSRVDSENYGQQHRKVMLLSLADRSKRPLPVRMAHVESLSWSPAGNRLLLAGSDRRGRGGLFIFDPAQGQTFPAVIDRNASFRGMPGVFADGGDSLIFIRSGDAPAIVQHNLDTEKETLLYDGRDAGPPILVDLSKDNGTLAFAVASPNASAEAEVFLQNLADGRREKILTLPSGEVTDLVWMPDGTELLVGTRGASGAQLWRVSAGGDKMRPVKTPANRKSGLSVHPDGNRLAYTAGESSEEIWVLENAVRPTAKARP